jgi:cyclopropane fatty-acyl-phospholipid synthase-like methyltransferase
VQDRAVSEPDLDPRIAMVRDGYDAIGRRYHDWSHAGSTRLRFARELSDRLAPGSTLVDLGCGPGDPATRLLSERHLVVGVDLSVVQLRIARQLAPEALLVRADISRFAIRPTTLDAVASFYALGHLPPDRHGPLLAAVAQWLRPGGVLVTSAPLSADESVEDGWLGVPMFFGGVGVDATVAAAAGAGLVVERAEHVVENDSRADDGSPEQFLWLVASRPRG